MKVLLIALFFALLCVISSAKEESDKSEEERSKRNVYNPGPSYESDNDNTCPYSLNSMLYQAPKCKTPNKCRASSSITPVDSAWLFSPRQFFVTLLTCYSQQLYARALLGRNPRTNQEQAEICLTVFADLGQGRNFYDGYGVQFSQTCSPNAEGNGLTCITGTTNTDPGVDIQVILTETCFMIASDNSSFALYYRCLGNRYEDIMLITTRPYIERNVFSQVVDALIKFGFPPEDVVPVHCYPPAYPVPFQNYIQDSCPAASSSCSSQSSYSYPSNPAPAPYTPPYSPPHDGDYNYPPSPGAYGHHSYH